MLIINISQKEAVKKQALFKKIRATENLFSRCNKTIDNRVYTLVDMPLELAESLETQRLLKRFKGNVLVCEKSLKPEYFDDYLFDCKPYYKRAVLSSLKNYIAGLNNKSFSLTVCDDSFELTKEAIDLARVVGKLVVEGEESLAVQEFCDFCFYKFGAVVRVLPKGSVTGTDMVANLNNITDDAKLFVDLKGRNLVLYPNPDYFLCKNGASELVSLGVSVKKACAATSKCEKIQWQNNPCRNSALHG